MAFVLVDQIEGKTCWHVTLTTSYRPSPLRPLIMNAMERFNRLR